jgi:hypothetical protein
VYAGHEYVFNIHPVNDMAMKSLADCLPASEGTSTGSGGVMLPGQGKFGVVISKIPVMQSGLKVIFNENLPDYELSFCRSHDELTLLQLRRAVLVVADISGEIAHPGPSASVITPS